LRVEVTALLRRLAANDAAGLSGRIAAAALCVAFGMIARFAAEPLLRGELGYATYFPAVAVAALWAGRSAGLIAIAFSIAAVWAFVPPYFQVVGGWTMGATKVVTFGASAGVLVLVAGAFREALRELGLKLAAEGEVAGALKASEARFRGVFQSGALGIAIVDMTRDGPIEVNDRFLEIAGVDRATWEAGGWNWREATPPEDLPKDEAAARALVETGAPQTFEKVWIRPDGERVPIVLSAALMPEFPGLAVVTVQDVSQVRRAEEAKRESEARLLLGLQAGRMIAWDADLETGEIRRSANAGELLGEDGTPADFYTRIHPDDRAADREAVRRAVETGEPYLSEYRYPHPDGGWLWLHNRGVVERDQTGRPRRLIGIAVDITARRQAEAALAESEARFRSIANTAPAPIWVTGADGRRAFVNDAYCAFVGRPYAEALTLDWREVLHPEDAARVRRESVEGEASGEPFTLLARYRCATGEWRWLRSYSRPRLEAGEAAGFVGVAFDVTEAMAAEAALRESEARFRAMADSAPAPIWVSDPDGAVQYANSAFLDFAGRPLEEVQGFWWREVIHPDDVSAAKEARERAQRDRGAYTLEQRLLDKHGRWRWYSVHGRPRFTPDGAFLGFVGISFDITETKRAQEALERLNDGLEERVRAALAEKEQAEAALLQAQKLEAIGRLTGGVAHDFNNLLTVVIGALDTIQKRGDDPVRRTRMADAALQAARRGERLTHQLLAFARRQALRPETTDVGALVLESEPLLRRAVGEAVDFKVQTPDAPVHVRVDAAQFEAALLNLVVNARDATPDGGRISIQVWERRFEAGEVADAPAGDFVCVEVADTGSGMPPEVLARVFEPFFTTKPVGKGTGLGLAQVYGFARQSGGDADVFSAPGQGTRVALRLPRVAPVPSRPAEPSAPTAVSVDGLAVLLVEDDPQVGQLAESLLADQGCVVARASSAGPALELLRGPTAFDVLLTDVVMPGGVNGVELARQAAALRPGLKIVLTSGYVGEALDGTLGDAPWPLLRKPYTAEQLVAALGGPVRATEPA
jgi:PAS domain S-box-containing protein